jgi:hypothetical protein
VASSATAESSLGDPRKQQESHKNLTRERCQQGVGISKRRDSMAAVPPRGVAARSATRRPGRIGDHLCRHRCVNMNVVVGDNPLLLCDWNWWAGMTAKAGRGARGTQAAFRKVRGWMRWSDVLTGGGVGRAGATPWRMGKRARAAGRRRNKTQYRTRTALYHEGRRRRLTKPARVELRPAELRRVSADERTSGLRTPARHVAAVVP